MDRIRTQLSDIFTGAILITSRKEVEQEELPKNFFAEELFETKPNRMYPKHIKRFGSPHH